jgi:hypothetical protein
MDCHLRSAGGGALHKIKGIYFFIFLFKLIFKRKEKKPPEENTQIFNGNPKALAYFAQDIPITIVRGER